MVQSSNCASEEGITNLVIWSLSQLDLKHDTLIIIIKYGTRLPGSWDAAEHESEVTASTTWRSSSSGNGGLFIIWFLRDLKS